MCRLASTTSTGALRDPQRSLNCIRRCDQLTYRFLVRLVSSTCCPFRLASSEGSRHVLYKNYARGVSWQALRSACCFSIPALCPSNLAFLTDRSLCLWHYSCLQACTAISLCIWPWVPLSVFYQVLRHCSGSNYHQLDTYCSHSGKGSWGTAQIGSACEQVPGVLAWLTFDVGGPSPLWAEPSLVRAG